MKQKIEEKLKSTLERFGNLDKFEYIDKRKDEKGDDCLYYYYEVLFNNQHINIAVDVEPWKILDYKEHYTVTYRNKGTLKWYLMDVKELNSLEFNSEYRDTVEYDRLKKQIN